VRLSFALLLFLGITDTFSASCTCVRFASNLFSFSLSLKLIRHLFLKQLWTRTEISQKALTRNICSCYAVINANAPFVIMIPHEQCVCQQEYGSYARFCVTFRAHGGRL